MLRVTFFISVALIVTGCSGDAVDKNNKNNTINLNNGSSGSTGTTGTNNDTTNSGCPDGTQKIIVGGVESCASRCVGGACSGGKTCVQDFCIDATTTNNNVSEPECFTKADCAAGEICTDEVCVTAPLDTCETGADCRADQRCADEECVDLMECFDSRENFFGDGCRATWDDCEDSKEYAFNCDFDDDAADCECEVNGVVVSSITTSADGDTCSFRNVNESCDWVLPEAR